MANGDGIDPCKNTLIEDCFIRTQDDSTYVNGRGIRRVVYWQDGNGSTFVLTPLGSEQLNTHTLIVEDCTVVYARSKWANNSGGRLFSLRAGGGGSGGDTVTFRNIVVEDKRPTQQAFMMFMEGVEPWGDPEKRRDPGDLFGITFQNITITARSVLYDVEYMPEVLWGMDDGLIYDLVFDNVVIAGEKIKSLDQFYHNEFVLPLVVP